MDDSTNKCISILNNLVQLSAMYQLSIDGEFNISRNKQLNKIDNELFANFDLKYINSGRLDFDGGIELTFVATGELANIFNDCNIDSALLVSIYNLNGEDYELEDYIVRDREDCNFLNVDKDIENGNAELLAQKLEDYWSGDRIGALRSFCAMKLGYAN
jgi:hypothetical protein